MSLRRHTGDVTAGDVPAGDVPAGERSRSCEASVVRTVLSIAVVVVGIVVGAIVVGPYFHEHGSFAAGGGPTTLVGAPAASYSLPRLDGSQDSLANYRGRI